MKTKITSIAGLLILSGASLFLAACTSTGSSPSTATSVSGVKPYPLKTCIVTDNDLGSMGDEQRFVYNGQEIKICCGDCKDQFLKNPAKYVAKLI